MDGAIRAAGEDFCGGGDVGPGESAVVVDELGVGGIGGILVACCEVGEEEDEEGKEE